MRAVATIMAMGTTAVSGVTPAWTDSIAPGSTDTTDGNYDFCRLQPIVAGQSGTCTKLRVYIGQFNGVFDIKLALYDNSNNLLSSGSLTGQTSANDTWCEVPITSQSVTASVTYGIGEMHDQGLEMQERYLSGSPANSSYMDFSTAYASFPPNPFSGTGLPRLYAYGMYIQ